MGPYCHVPSTSFGHYAALPFVARGKSQTTESRGQKGDDWGLRIWRGMTKGRESLWIFVDK
jgi:hypothetical protein